MMKKPEYKRCERCGNDFVSVAYGYYDMDSAKDVEYIEPQKLGCNCSLWKPDSSEEILQKCKAKIDAALREFDASINVVRMYKYKGAYTEKWNRLNISIGDETIVLSDNGRNLVYNGKEVGE